MKIILLGAPGAGKGTQAEVICKKLGIPTISTGVVLREAVANGTETGKKAKAFMDSGGLVPDEVVVGIIKDRVKEDDCKNGFVLDGFPRTIPQAQALNDMGIDVDRVISIEVNDQDIVKRMSGRRVCKNCSASYHTEYKQPDKDGVCNACSGELIQRADDHPDTVLSRLAVFHEQTEPLKEFYQKSGKLRLVIGQEEVADTTKLTLQALEA